MNWKILLAALLITILLFGCKKDPTPVADDSGATAEGVKSVVNANNQFALELYSELKGQQGNVFFSPYSICSNSTCSTY